MNNRPDSMTAGLDPDAAALVSGKSMALPFESSSSEMAGIRVTRAEFSRLMGCSKQAVTEWVKSGRITVGIDGRVDPRQAVSQLLRTGDPSRLRVRVLEPLVREVASADAKISAMKIKLAEAEEAADFHEAASIELLEVQQAFTQCLIEDWDQLRFIDRAEAEYRFEHWLDRANFAAGYPGFGIFGFALPRSGEAEGERGNLTDGDDHAKPNI